MGKYNEVLNWVNRADDRETIGREDEDEGIVEAMYRDREYIYILTDVKILSINPSSSSKLILLQRN